MKKNIITILAMSLLLLGCNDGKKQEKNTNEAIIKKPVVKNINLTEEELKETKDNPTMGAQVLVRKALLSEAEKEKYTDAEKKDLDFLKKNVEIEYFLNKKAGENINVSDAEVLKVYDQNKEKLKNVTKEQAIPYLKEQIFLSKREGEKTDYINAVIVDYNLNNKLLEYFPELKTGEKKAKE